MIFFGEIHKEKMYNARLNQLAAAWKKADHANDQVSKKIYLDHFKFLLSDLPNKKRG